MPQRSIISKLTESEIPGFIAAATLAAAAALWQQEGRSTLMPPFLACAIIISYWLPYRIRSSFVRYSFRVPIFVLACIVYRIRPPAPSDSYFLDPFVLDQFAELCIAEIAIRAWSRYPSGYNRAVIVLPLGAAFVIATNTTEENIGRFYVPVFMLMLLLGLQALRSGITPSAARRARAGVSVAIAASFLIGAILYRNLNNNKDAISEWATRLINNSEIPFSSSGLSERSRLGSALGRSGNYDRVIRIHTSADVMYMRAYSMDTYNQGYWEPVARNRTYEPISAAQLQTNSKGEPATVYRYSSVAGMVLVPINALSIGIDGSTNLRWARAQGGPIRMDGSGPDSYTMTIGSAEQQGLICQTPDADQIRKLLVVPKEIDGRIFELARKITANEVQPLRKARAIEAYLPANHEYSTRIHVGSRDPLGDFLFSHKSAHCEFFASAAVMLMRCAGIPSRYVIGYYAHEQESGDTVVRQRDAHAWAECWTQETGWVTIDATPLSGKPNGETESVPGWKRMLEKLQDWLTNFRQSLTAENFTRLAGVLVCLTLAMYLIQNRYHFKWKRNLRQVARDYTSGPADLRALYGKFEAICRKNGLVCPRQVPWQEYLRSTVQRHITSSATIRRTSTVESAVAFIAAYDLARFGGGSVGPEDYIELQRALNELELESKRVVTEENSR